MGSRYDYSAWDGSQEFSNLDPEDLLAALEDDLLANGDLSDALERLLRNGFELPDGERVDGLRDLLDQTRRRREELLQQGDPDGELARYRDRLSEIEEMERTGLDELAAEAGDSGDQRRQEVTDQVVAERRMALDLLPDDLAGRMRSLGSYEFTSTEAREAFEALQEEIRQEIADTYFKGMSELLNNTDPEQIARTRAAMDALSQMLEQRQRGEDLDPTFEQFMEEFGDMFPGAESLDDLLEQMARQMAAAEAMWRSLSAEQRAELQGLADAMFEDMDLRWSMDRLGANLRAAFPDLGWNDAFRFEGEGSLSMSEAADAARQLADLERMEDLLSTASSAAALNEIDIDALRRNLGDDAAAQLERLAQMVKSLEDSGLINNKGGKMELTAHGVRRLGNKALQDLFTQLRQDRVGQHQTSFSGFGHDREETTRAYEPGDPLTLHLSKTVHNAVARTGGGTPVKLEAEDFEVVETEAVARSATVLCIDLSMSMPMRDNFVPAKKMAMALQTLISSRFPRDYLGLVVFSEVAREVKPSDLPTVMWDYIYGTNLQHALALSRTMLAKQHGTKQIIVVTDGEPTAHLDRSGVPHFSYPPAPETLHLTMAEVIRCTRAGITINTFALDLERTHYPFVEQIAQVNGGRTFYPSNDDLGGYVLVDFLKHRRVLRPSG
ncbi:MAG: VWA domain-containing protein [Actinomycetes bacterium]